MSDTRPRDLTAEELALLEGPAIRGNESVPLRIPPGAQIAIELLNPAAAVASASGVPTGGPNEVSSSGAGGATPGTTPSQNPAQT